MKGSSWGWSPHRSEGIWRYGPRGLRPLAVIAPWLTIGLLLLMLYFLSGTFTASEGVLFDLPDAAPLDGEATPFVILAMPVRGETTLFFDDARYVLNEGSAMSALDRHLKENISRSPQKALLIMADRRITGGDLAKLTAAARKSGVKRVLFANKRERTRRE